MNTLHIKKDDNVIVISGDDKGKQGKVLTAYPEKGRVSVQGANMITKHVKPRRQGEAGGIIEVDGAIYADKVLLFCDKCGKGVRTKVQMDGDKKIRVCAKCGAKL